MSERRDRVYHSITIGSKNTWNDWHLIPTTRPLFNPPTVKTNLVNIPGGDGLLDLTTALTGRPTYNNRTGSWTFIVQNGFKDWATLYSEIMDYLHGRHFLAVLEDDMEYYYEGRFSVNQWQSNKDWSQIVIDYNVGPYKKKTSGIGTEWIWDTFDFRTGIIRNYKNLQVSSSLNVIVPGELIDTTLIVICSATRMKMTFGGTTYSLSKGANVIPDIHLSSGDNTLKFTGNGTITIENGGRL